MSTTTETTTPHLDYEATLLRTAGAIRELLSDGDPHQWRECIDLAYAIVPSRRLASRLAWAALTRFIDPSYIVEWSGEKGDRSIVVVAEMPSGALVAA